MRVILRYCEVVKTGGLMVIQIGSTTTDREQTDPDWLRRVVIEILYYPHNHLA